MTTVSGPDKTGQPAPRTADHTAGPPTGRRTIPRRHGARRALARSVGDQPVGALCVVVLLITGLALFWIPLRGVRLDAMTGYGLISVLPVTTLVGAGVLAIAFVATLGAARPRRTLLAVQLLSTVVSLHGLAPVLEPVARFPTTWQHAGLIEYITRTHGVDTLLDARFNWPAFFALAGFVTKAVGQDHLDPVLRWAPLVTNLAYLGPLWLILRTLRANWRAKYFAAWVFAVANWVGQDYLSPQAFGYLLYLCWIAILVNWFRPDAGTARKEGRRRTPRARPRTGPFWRCYDWAFGPTEPGELPPRPASVQDRSVLFLLLVAIFMVATAAHQLTPFLMIAVTTGLVLARRCTLRGLPVLGCVIFASWVSLMTRAYWAGHLDEVFGGMGRLGANLSTSVAGRITQGSPQLAGVQTGRVALAVLVAILALLGLLRRHTARMNDRVVVVLFLAPFASFGLQSYGGEIALRTYFFMLPGACVLLAYLFFPDPVSVPAVRTRPRRRRLRRWRPAIAAGAFALVLISGFLLVRFGNEKFERIRPGDLKAFDAMLQRRPKGPIDVVWLTAEDTTGSGFPVMPWSYRSYERFSYPVVSTSRVPGTDVLTVAAKLHDHGADGFFVTTRGHEAYLELSGGLPAGYGTRLREALSRSAAIAVVYADRDAAVFTLRSPPSSPDPPPPTATPVTVGMTPWTPACLVYLPVLLGVLIARELRRLRAPRGERRPLRPYTVLAVPLLVGLIAVVVERFLTLR
ncbi:MAG: hypothetical protein JWQ39_168 [Glaciihabitans sp.]|nr:hypothetical protein [Glaciihabitans sp.]